jgi:hypothetical protein
MGILLSFGEVKCCDVGCGKNFGCAVDGGRPFFGIFSPLLDAAHRPED